MRQVVSIMLCAVLSLSLFAACTKSQQHEEGQPPKEIEIQPPENVETPPSNLDGVDSMLDSSENNPSNPSVATQLAYLFASNPGYTYNGTPSVPAYTVEPELANIANRLQFTTGYAGEDDGFYWLATMLSEETIDRIVKNGFAVSDKANWTEFFAVYETNRYKHVPNFITTDSAVHTFHLLFDYVLKDLERQNLYDELVNLSGRMMENSDIVYNKLAGTELENAARRNVAFFAIGSLLLDPGFAVPDYVQELVSQELALIEAHAGIAESPLINTGQTFNSELDYYLSDYTQYIPRGRYTLTPQLTAYFKAMMWYGQMTFRSAYEDEVKSAMLQTLFLQQDSMLEDSWMKIFEPTNFFVGECDDITWHQYKVVLEDVYGSDIGYRNSDPGPEATPVIIAELLDAEDSDYISFWDIADPERFLVAFEAIGQLDPPAINSIPIYGEELQPDRNKAITGYRFMGQRFTIDGAIMQRLMARETPERMLPKALDIPAAFGSAEAYAILESEGVLSKYPAYEHNMEEIRQYISGLDNKVWHSNLYWTWMDMLRPFTNAQAGEGMPFFMQNQAWKRKEINTFLSSWSELKHDTILYAKQPMAEMGGGGEPPEPPDDRGYVEPNPEIFGRLANLVQMTLDGLEQRSLLTEPARESLGVLKTLADGLRTISEKELANEPLTEEEYHFIRIYGGELEHIFQVAKKDELADRDYNNYLNEHPSAIIADVATNPNGTVLEQATGFVKEIYVAFPRDGQVVLGRGSVFSHYEFEMPLAERMTVEDWHEQLLSGYKPDVDEWKKSFITDLDFVNPNFYPRTRIDYLP